MTQLLVYTDGLRSGPLPRLYPRQASEVTNGHPSKVGRSHVVGRLREAFAPVEEREEACRRDAVQYPPYGMHLRMMDGALDAAATS